MAEKKDKGFGDPEEYNGIDRADSPGQEEGQDINTDENVGGTTHLNDDLAEADKLQSELQEMKDKYLRLVA